MAGFSNRTGYIGIGKQTAKGTGVVPTKFIKWAGGTKLSPEMAFTRYREGGDTVFPGISLKETHAPDGNFPLLARPDIAGFLFAMWAGKDLVSGTGPYSHAITPDVDPPWLSIERSVAAQIIDRIVDAKIRSIEVTGEAGKPPRLAVAFNGITTAKQATGATTTYETDMPWVFFQGTYTLDGVVTAVIESFRATFVNEFDTDDYTNQVVRDDLILMNRDVTLEWVMKLVDAAQYFKVYNGASANLVPANALTEGAFIADLTYGTGAALRDLKLEVPLIAHEVAAAELETGGGRLRYECKAHAKKGTGALATITVQNSTTLAYV